MKEFFIKMNSIWNDVLELNKTHKFINVFKDRIEGIR
jgi:hypothetical protein